MANVLAHLYIQQTGSNISIGWKLWVWSTDKCMSNIYWIFFFFFLVSTNAWEKISCSLDSFKTKTWSVVIWFFMAISSKPYIQYHPYQYICSHFQWFLLSPESYVWQADNILLIHIYSSACLTYFVPLSPLQQHAFYSLPPVVWCTQVLDSTSVVAQL